MSAYDPLILQLLGDTGGFTTGDIAARLSPRFGANNHQHSAYIRRQLLRLERDGFVKQMDDLKPVCWMAVIKEPTP